MNLSTILPMDVSMFDFDALRDHVTVLLDGESTRLPSGMTVACALLGTGRSVSRVSPVSGRPCSPHCLMGVCFECLMEIDGVLRQACMTDVREGMVINRQLSRETGEKP